MSKKEREFCLNCILCILTRNDKIIPTNCAKCTNGGKEEKRMLDQSYYRKTDEIIEHYGRKAGSLIPIMQDIQAEYRYLPGELLTYVAKDDSRLRFLLLRRSAFGNRPASSLVHRSKSTEISTELLTEISFDFPS